VHCKDVRQAVMVKARNNDQSFLNSVLDGVFTVPGDGMIDFEPILALLAEHNYTGWLVVEAEQDPAVAPSYEYAKKGYDCLAGLVAKINGKA
jgi:inosose dehydratase